jgi:hypothetical protein
MQQSWLAHGPASTCPVHRRLGRPSAVAGLGRRALEGMKLCYTLDVKDHLAWYDLCVRLYPPRGTIAMPFIGWLLRRRARRKYEDSMKLPANRNALGERSIEISDRGVQESTDAFEFFVPWTEITVAAATNEHVFLARPCLNAFVIPPLACASSVERDSLLDFIQNRTNLRRII